MNIHINDYSARAWRAEAEYSTSIRLSIAAAWLNRFGISHYFCYSLVYIIMTSKCILALYENFELECEIWSNWSFNWFRPIIFVYRFSFTKQKLWKKVFFFKYASLQSTKKNRIICIFRIICSGRSFVQAWVTWLYLINAIYFFLSCLHKSVF